MFCYLFCKVGLLEVSRRTLQLGSREQFSLLQKLELVGIKFTTSEFSI